MTFLKTCRCCSAQFSLEEFLELPLPDNGIGEAHGMLWRLCSGCTSTLVVDFEEIPSITSQENAA